MKIADIPKGAELHLVGGKLIFRFDGVFHVLKTDEDGWRFSPLPDEIMRELSSPALGVEVN